MQTPDWQASLSVGRSETSPLIKPHQTEVVMGQIPRRLIQESIRLGCFTMLLNIFDWLEFKILP